MLRNALVKMTRSIGKDESLVNVYSASLKSTGRERGEARELEETTSVDGPV